MATSEDPPSLPIISYIIQEEAQVEEDYDDITDGEQQLQEDHNEQNSQGHHRHEQNDLVSVSSVPNGLTREEILDSSASAEQQCISASHVTEKVVSDDAGTSSSSEPIQTIATNNTEVVEPEASTQIAQTYTIPNVMSMPLDMTVESLDQLESELRRSATSLKEVMLPIDAEKKKLDGDRAQLEELLKSHRTDYSSKKQVIDTLAKKLEERVEKKRQCTEKKKEMATSFDKVKQDVFQAKVSLRYLQTVLVLDQTTLLADPSPDSPLNTGIESKKAKIKVLESEISELEKGFQSAQDAVYEVESEIKKIDYECQSLRMRITSCEKESEKAALQSKNVEDNLRKVTDRLADLETQYNGLYYQFVELEKIMVKVKMTRKLKKLETKQEKFSTSNQRLAGGHRAATLH